MRISEKLLIEYNRGYVDGVRIEKERQNNDLKLKQMQANIQLANSISSLAEASSKAVIAFISEGGFRVV